MLIKNVLFKVSQIAQLPLSRYFEPSAAYGHLDDGELIVKPAFKKRPVSGFKKVF